MLQLIDLHHMVISLLYPGGPCCHRPAARSTLRLNHHRETVAGVRQVVGPCATRSACLAHGSVVIHSTIWTKLLNCPLISVLRTPLRTPGNRTMNTLEGTVGAGGEPDGESEQDGGLHLPPLFARLASSHCRCGCVTKRHRTASTSAYREANGPEA